MTKRQFIKLHLEKNIKINHLSERQLDYKYNEYKLYLILKKYIHDFSILGLTCNLSIVYEPEKDDYNILRRSHVTLNHELLKLYECGYFKTEREFVKYVATTVNSYKKNKATIKELVKITRNKRLQYSKEPF